jgi:hypothetical protein
LRNILKVFFICFLFVFYLSCNNLFYIGGQIDSAVHDSSLKKDIFKSHKLMINDTFSIEGSLISTTPPNMSSIFLNKSNYVTPQLINNSNNKTNSGTTGEERSLVNNSNTTSILSLQQKQQSLFPGTKSFSANITNTQSNESNKFSDNLVSLLSGIIIESIHNGNPTINNTGAQTDSKSKNKNDIILISGTWKLDVENGNIDNFASKFIMTSVNGNNFHMESMNNFTSKEKLFLGNDESIAIKGQLDYYTGTNTTKKTVDALLTLNNFELIQITILDKEIAHHFHEAPLYGTIDLIKIKN